MDDVDHLKFWSLSLAAAATEAETPAGCVVRIGSFLSSATATPSASFLVAALSDPNLSVAFCHSKYISPSSIKFQLNPYILNFIRYY